MDYTTTTSTTTNLPMAGAPANIDPNQFIALFGGIWLFVMIAVVISSILKGMALWKAGRRGEKGWFIALFIINTLGILELLYLLAFSKEKSASKA